MDDLPWWLQFGAKVDPNGGQHPSSTPGLPAMAVKGSFAGAAAELQGAGAKEILGKAREFLVKGSGEIFIRPEDSSAGAVINKAGKQTGQAYVDGTMPTPKGDRQMDLRFMDANKQYPEGYAAYSKNLPAGGHQNLDPYTGKTNNPNGLGAPGKDGGIDVKGPHFDHAKYVPPAP
ncbi:MAG: hypothetical protein KGS72_04610 [Cyanobacteria bacterium REEB67]|nr:hypothetical protein [Cyanobacteria bacterium REEB67]